MFGFLKLIAGVAAVVGSFFVPGTWALGAMAISSLLASAGAGMVLSGLGTLLAHDPVNGYATVLRDSKAPWSYLYGYGRPKSSLAYWYAYGDNNQTLDMVIVLSDHPSAIDVNHPPVLQFDTQRVAIDTSKGPPSGSTNPGRWGGVSYSPVNGSSVTIKLNQSGPVQGSIVRSNGVVTVTCPANIPALLVGGIINISHLPEDTTNVAVQTLEGNHQVEQIITQVFGDGGYIVFTYLSGGQDVNIQAAGWVMPVFADYGATVYVEIVDGTQSYASMVANEQQLFWGMQQNIFDVILGSVEAQPTGSGAPLGTLVGAGPWNPACALQGKTAMFLRMQYDQSKYPGGLPQISVLMYGKNNIYDPRTGTYGYTDNAALCIADFLADTTLGFSCAYGTDIPIGSATTPGSLIFAANQCDQSVPLAAGGAEAMYALNGAFSADSMRGEILRNMLTSCAGRLTTFGGQFMIWPGCWNATGGAPAVDLKAIAAGPLKWHPVSSITERYNRSKGTYVSSGNKWQSTSFPAYCQDSMHGYNGPSQYGGDIELAADGGQRRDLEIQLPFTTSASMAQRIAKIYLLRSRWSGGGTFPCNMTAYQYAPMDILSCSQAVLGWNGVLLEVIDARLKAEKASTGKTETVRLLVELDLQQTDSSIYAWSTEEELTAQGYTQTVPPTGQALETYPWPWSPGYVAPLAGDALYPQGPTAPASFGVVATYGADAQGNATAGATLTGYPPASALDTGIAKPSFQATAATGGSLAAGTYVIGLSARDSGSSNYGAADYLNVQVVSIPAAGGAIDISVTWGSGDDGGDLYIAEWNAAGYYTFHWNQFIPSWESTATISSFDQSKPGGPDPDFYRFGVTWMAEIHGGPWANEITSVTPTTVTFGGAGMNANQWAGYTLSLLAKFASGAAVPILNIPIASSTASAGTPAEFTLTIGPNSAGQTLPDLTTLLVPGDLMLIRYNATFTSTGFRDPNIANGYYPSGATGVNLQGLVAIVMTGVDAGDIQPIASVGSDGVTINLVGKWATTPNTGDVVIICDPTEAAEIPSAQIAVPNPATPVNINLNVLNIAGETLLLIVRTKDANGNNCPDNYAAMREVYFFGAGGSTTVSASGAMS